MHRAVEVVILEGPASLADVAQRVTHASRELPHVVQRMTKSAHEGDATRKTEEAALATEREHALYQAVKDFRVTARNIIGSAG